MELLGFEPGLPGESSDCLPLHHWGLLYKNVKFDEKSKIVLQEVEKKIGSSRELGDQALGWGI